MKKILSVFMLGGVALSANAQQINGGFDAEWVECVPWDSKGNTWASTTRLCRRARLASAFSSLPDIHANSLTRLSLRSSRWARSLEC
jgi:hypothetical protein